MIRERPGPAGGRAAQTPNGCEMNRISLSEYTVIPLWYECNNNCAICMLTPIKGKLPAIDFDLFKKLVIGVASSGRCRRLILSGAEVTTFTELERYVAFAAGLGWFETIQIQTNGRRLSDPAYLRTLVRAGVNEFFISVHGPGEVHDALSRVPGSYHETMEGMANLEAYDVNLITNTVLTRLDLAHVPALLSNIAAGKASEMNLWNFFPMQERDTQDLVVGISNLLAMLSDVLPILVAARKPLVLKAFPECLPVSDPVVVDSDFPLTLIPDVFWEALGRSGFGMCKHREACGAKKCWGLSRAYITKYGDEEDGLSPIYNRPGPATPIESPSVKKR